MVKLNADEAARAVVDKKSRREVEGDFSGFVGGVTGVLVMVAPNFQGDYRFFSNNDCVLTIAPCSGNV
jgi:hypothetical protein